MRNIDRLESIRVNSDSGMRDVEERLKAFPKVSICNLDILNTNESDCVNLIIDHCRLGRGGWVITPNLDILKKCSSDEEIHAMCNRADILVADGMPLIWISILQGNPIKQRVAGSNLILSLSEACAQNDLQIFLLGGNPGTAQKAGEVLTSKFPELRVAGHYCPPFGFENNIDEVEYIGQLLEASGADLVFVALGFPKAEKLIGEVKDRLPKAWWIGVGISFSYVSGEVKRAPRWFQSIGAEWIFRLIQEPNRLVKRYLVDDLPFAARLFASALKESILNNSNRS